MDIIISNSGGVPIYEQITRQMKGLILRGDLREGEALPSMRLLAKDLRISVITTKRAYEELEREGFLTTVPGKAALWPPGTWGWSGRRPCAGWRSACPRRWVWPRAGASPWRSWNRH